jgi:hypothetical protein
MTRRLPVDAKRYSIVCGSLNVCRFKMLIYVVMHHMAESIAARVRKTLGPVATPGRSSRLWTTLDLFMVDPLDNIRSA